MALSVDMVDYRVFLLLYCPLAGLIVCFVFVNMVGFVADRVLPGAGPFAGGGQLPVVSGYLHKGFML